MTAATATVPTGNAYRTGYAAARDLLAAADKALTTALKHIEPPTAELHALFLTMPEQYAKALHQMADIAASLPMLRENVARAATIADEYAQFACYRCHGTGDYDAPTTHLSEGRPKCWKCGGTGDSRTGK